MSLNAPSLRFPLARLVQAVSAILALLLLGVSSAQAGPASMPPPPACTVGGAAPSHASIQAAVDDPACTTVRLAAGSYYEHVVITRSVKVVGAGSEIDPTPTVINGSLAGRVFSVQKPTSPSIDVTINSLVIEAGAAGDGAGLFVDTFADVTLKNATVRFNNGNDGGGIYNKGQLTVVASTVRDNIAGNNGGGIMSKAVGISTQLNLINTVVMPHPCLLLRRRFVGQFVRKDPRQQRGRKLRRQ